MISLILIRHGRIEERGSLTGQLPGTLSEQGKKQAREIAKKIKKIDKIYSSDLLRAKETAQEIIKIHDVPLHYSYLLREKDFGELQGIRKSALGFSSSDIIGTKIESVDGESNQQVYDRARNFLSNLDDDGKTIMIVGHNAINLALIAAVKGLGAQSLKEMDSLENANITELSFECVKS